MTKSEQLKTLIRKMIVEEVQKNLPHIVKEVMSGLIMESTVTPPVFRGNSDKRRSLTEISRSAIESDDLDEYPTMPVRIGPDRRLMAERMGYGDMIAPGEAMTDDGRTLIVSSKVTERGTAIPVDPRELPDELVDALTKDYRPIMDAFNRRKNNG